MNANNNINGNGRTGESFNHLAIEVKDLYKSFKRKKVLKGFSFNLHRGENLIIMGRSGSGKSVLIKCLVGLMKPDSGSIKIFGQDIPELKQQALDEVRQKIGFLFQSSALYDSMTVKENLQFPLRNKKEISSEEIDSRITEVLENIGLPDTTDMMPTELSGGMKKRIGLGRALMIHPEIIMYDEPTTGLDPITGTEICHLILDVQRKYSASSIIITHDQLCAKITGNRIVMISDGVSIANGTFDEVVRIKEPFIQSFFQKKKNNDG